MRVRTLGSFFVAAALAGIVLSMPSVGAAQTAPAPPLSCNITIGTATIAVQAGPDGVPFPEAVACPATTGAPTGDCLRWRYKYTNSTGGNISLSGVTASADITAVVASGGQPPEDSFAGAQVFDAGVGDTALSLGRNVFDVRAIRFSQQAATVYGNVYTPTGVALGKATAAGKIGNALGFCSIAGASNVTPNGTGKLAVTTTVIDQAGQCLIARQVDGQGCTVTIDSMTEGCTVLNTDTANLGSSGEALSGVSCSTQVTFGANSKYCYASTYGRLVCVNSP